MNPLLAVRSPLIRRHRCDNIREVWGGRRGGAGVEPRAGRARDQARLLEQARQVIGNAAQVHFVGRIDFFP